MINFICSDKLPSKMNPYQETFNTWNQVAAIYENKFMHLDLYNVSYDFICNHVTKQNAAILEIGCGPGNITKYLLNKRPDFKIYGTDAAPNMIELAAKNNPGAKFEVMDARNLNQLEGTFDAIVCGFCLPYLSSTDSKQLFSEAFRLLHPRGLFYLSFVEGNPENSGFQSGSSGLRCFFYYHELNTVIQQLRENSFRDFEMMKVEYKKSETETEIHTVVVAFK